MEQPVHSLKSLFGQLGLNTSDEAIIGFINHHKPVPEDLCLSEAGFWSESQAAFLKQAIKEDADWSGVVDQLNAMFRN